MSKLFLKSVVANKIAEGQNVYYKPITNNYRINYYPIKTLRQKERFYTLIRYNTLIWFISNTPVLRSGVLNKLDVIGYLISIVSNSKSTTTDTNILAYAYILTARRQDVIEHAVRAMKHTYITCRCLSHQLTQVLL